MKYLEMEHERLEMMQSIKEAREKRSFTMLQLLISLAAIVIVVFLLRDNPTVLVNILYIVGIIIVLWILKYDLTIICWLEGSVNKFGSKSSRLFKRAVACWLSNSSP